MAVLSGDNPATDILKHTNRDNREREKSNLPTLLPPHTCKIIGMVWRARERDSKLIPYSQGTTKIVFSLYLFTDIVILAITLKDHRSPYSG